jgi:leader peptidase (prepilin peptidase) / N-methyltransferase
MIPAWFALIVVAAFGLLVGSFLNVCIYRLPKHASIVWPGSACASCNQPLAWFENVPLVSYVVLRGRCRTCHAPISIRYPIVEAITMGLFLLHWDLIGPQGVLLPRLAFACALLVLFAIDLEHQILPDVITLPGIVVGFLCSLVWPPGPLSSLLGILAGGGILWLLIEIWLRVRHVQAMGFGDVKMLAMVGAFLGIKLVILTFVLSSIVGGLVGLALIASRRGNLATAVPFGTMLAAGALVASLYGDAIVTWYLGLYGAAGTVPGA